LDAKASRAPATAAHGAHARGDVLLAVAEGDPLSQPDEATLAHIFSCEQCSQNVRELRSSLAALGLETGRAKAAAARGGARPTEPIAAPAAGSGPDAQLGAELGMNGGTQLDAEAEAEQRSRRMIWKLVLFGVVIAAALIFLRSFAASLR
jgi:hypothetical protein